MNKKKFIATGHVGNPRLNLEEELKDEPIINCKHASYCQVKNFGRINCLTESSIKNCATYKFYQKYGENYNMLGVGC